MVFAAAASFLGLRDVLADEMSQELAAEPWNRVSWGRKGDCEGAAAIVTRTLQKNGDFSVVLAVKKEKKRAPQALADGRKGTGKG